MRKPYTKVQYKNGKKQCTNCGIYKDTLNFHKYSKAQDGLKPWCKQCVREYDQIEDDPKRIMPRKQKDGFIHCRYCEQYLPKSSFWSKNTYCKTCQPLIGHLSNLKKYGLTRDDYVNLEKSQNGLCKICGEKEKYNKRLSVDHNHTCCSGPKSCGKCIRGLLCSRCNKVLGQINDNINLLKKMTKYLS